MRGFIYRLGISIKEFGERKRLNFINRLGMKIRDYISGV